MTGDVVVLRHLQREGCLIEGIPTLLIEGTKNSRGILNYALSGRDKSAITWKLIAGEQYVDKVRGPLNEGGLYAERQGFHLPYPPNYNWASGNPMRR
jgi:hypothetical protein